jgi:hypothetical protein
MLSGIFRWENTLVQKGAEKILKFRERRVFFSDAVLPLYPTFCNASKMMKLPFELAVQLSLQFDFAFKSWNMHEVCLERSDTVILSARHPYPGEYT